MASHTAVGFRGPEILYAKPSFRSSASLKTCLRYTKASIGLQGKAGGGEGGGEKQVYGATHRGRADRDSLKSPVIAIFSVDSATFLSPRRKPHQKARTG